MFGNLPGQSGHTTTLPVRPFSSHDGLAEATGTIATTRTSCFTNPLQRQVDKCFDLLIGSRSGSSPATLHPVESGSNFWGEFPRTSNGRNHLSGRNLKDIPHSRVSPMHHPVTTVRFYHNSRAAPPPCPRFPFTGQLVFKIFAQTNLPSARHFAATQSRPEWILDMLRMPNSERLQFHRNENDHC